MQKQIYTYIYMCIFMCTYSFNTWYETDVSLILKSIICKTQAHANTATDQSKGPKIPTFPQDLYRELPSQSGPEPHSRVDPTLNLRLKFSFLHETFGHQI